MSKKQIWFLPLLKYWTVKVKVVMIKLLQIQKQMKYLKIKWAVLKWNDWWMLIKAINEET